MRLIQQPTAASCTDLALAQRRRVEGIRVVWVTVGMLLTLYAWVASRGLVWFDTDSDWVKQAALVKLMTGRFAAPMAEGNIPHAQQVYHWYPLYPAVLATYFKAAGTSHAAQIWFDLGVNCLAACLGAWWLVRQTRSGWGGAICLLSVQYLVAFKFGRPESLTSLAIMAAAVVTVHQERRFSWLVGVPLGCAIAASYPAGLACCAAWAGFVWVTNDERRGKRLFYLLTAGLLAGVTALAVWLYVVHPYEREAMEALVYNSQKLGGSSSSLALSSLMNLRLSLPLMAALALLGIAGWGPSTVSGHFEPRELRLVRGAFGGALAYLAVLFLFLRRPAPYYLPPLVHLLFPVATYLVWRWSIGRGQAMGPLLPWRLLGLCGLPILIWLNVFLVRATVLPLGWNERSMTPLKALNLIKATVPRGSTLGGDGKLLSVVGTNWVFISLNWAGTNNWPEYIVSPVHPVTLEPTLYGFKSFGPKARVCIEREYVPVQAGPATPEPCTMTKRLRHWGMPVPRYLACDWSIRIWQRRHSSEAEEAEQSD